MRLFPVIEGVQLIAYLAYLTAMGVMTHSLLQIPETWAELFYLFPGLLFAALVFESRSLKHIFAISAVGLFLGVGFYFPISVTYARDTLLFLPLCYVVLFPGTLWPIVIGVCMINAYMHQLQVSEFSAFVDVSLRMSATTSICNHDELFIRWN